jgi:predicted transposase YbfD/YdcC
MNQSELRASLLEYFQTLADPRIERTRAHSLIDIIGIAICAVVSGAEGFTDIERYGRAKQQWLGQFLELANGIPSHDTFGRFFAALDPAAFHECFLAWVRALGELTGGMLVAIDGKTARRSHDTARGTPALHVVSAWASAQRIVLGQKAVDSKSNEITAIPQLLAMLALKGATVTIDAMGCQKEIAGVIIDKKADYVLALKENHPTLHTQTVGLFEQRALEATAIGAPAIGAPAIGATAIGAAEFIEQTDAGHGRVEVRRCWTADVATRWAVTAEWPGLRTVAMIERERHIGAKISVERWYYLSSLPSDAALIARAVREHWAIENSLHWVLDVTFSEDSSRVRLDHAVENFVLLRKIALNLLSAEPSKNSIRGKRKIAGWNDDFLVKVLAG